jgi:hypothetical protein
VRLIREIHAELLSGVRGGNLRPGDLRSSQNWIGPAGSTLATATFVPPPHHVVPDACDDLERIPARGRWASGAREDRARHVRFESTRSSTATEAWLRVILLGFVEDADQATATAGRIILRYGPPHPGDAVPRAGARGVSGP